MIRKIGESFKITEVWQQRTRVFKVRLKKSEWRALEVKPSDLTKKMCVNCKAVNRSDIYSVQLVPEGLWICDDCAAQFCRELLREAERLREESYERHYGISKEEQEKRSTEDEKYCFEGTCRPEYLAWKRGLVPSPTKKAD